MLKKQSTEADNGAGLVLKYRIYRGDGSPLPDKARCFVLRWDTDPTARVALRAYADATPHRKLAADLYEILAELDKDE